MAALVWQAKKLDAALDLRLQLAVAVAERRFGAALRSPSPPPLRFPTRNICSCSLKGCSLKGYAAASRARAEDAAVIARMIAAVAGADAAGAELILAMEIAVAEERYADAAALRDKLAALNPLLEQKNPPGGAAKGEA